MNKAAAQKTMNNASAFQWDPNNDQTYGLAQDFTQPGIPSDFNKARGTRFTMDALGYTLTLQIKPSEAAGTYWSVGGGSGQTLIEVKNGTFVYDTITNKGVRAALWFVDDFSNEHIKTVVTVANYGQLVVKGEPASNGGGLLVFGIAGVSISVADNGLVDMTGAFDFSGADIVLAQQGRLSMVSSTSGIKIQDSTVNVSSSPPTGYSLNWVGGAQHNMYVQETTVAFSAASTGFLRGQWLTVEKTNISVSDTAKCNLQFDSLTVNENAVQFILGAGTAKMQFDGYSNGTNPFDFINNDPKSRYPQGMFNFTSKGTINGGSFVIRVGSGFEANAIVSNGFVAIDGVVLTALGRVDATFNAPYATITQIKA
jgi:hypothetical protein